MCATIKQKKALALIVKNKGNVSRSMKEAGYSSASAKNPKVLTKSKGWNELRKKYLPQEDLAKLHQEQLKAKKMQVVNRAAKLYPDNDARIKALDLGYKIYGSYAAEKIDLKGKYSDLSNKDLADKINKLKGFLMKK